MQDPDDPQLWSRISGLHLGQTAEGESFEHRIAARAGLDLQQADDAVLEYRRFLYLSALNPDTAAPSPLLALVLRVHREVPQAEQALRRITPAAEAPGSPLYNGNRRQRRQTRAAYRAQFGTTPPTFVWGGGTETRAFALHAGALACLFVWLCAEFGFDPILFFFALFSGIWLARLFGDWTVLSGRWQGFRRLP